MKLISNLVLILFLVSLFFGSGPADSPWPMFHGGAQHGGQSPYDTSHIGGTVKWTYETGEGIESSPVIGSDGTIYIGSHDGYLYALNPNGTLKWKFYAGDPFYDEIWDVSKAIMATPAVADDGTIYIYSSSNHIYAINPDGSEKWKFPIIWDPDFWSSPTIGPDGTIYIGSAMAYDDPDYKGGLFALNPDGTEKWFFSCDSGITSTAAIGKDGTVYFGGNILSPDSESGNIGVLYALNSDGTEKWIFEFESWMESSPTIAEDGTIYISTGREAKFYAFNPDGTEKWHFQADTGASSVPAIGIDGKIYAGAWDTYMYALDPEDGSLIWKYKTPDVFEGILSSAAVGSDGTIYVGSNSGVFYAFNPDGTVKWTLEDSSLGSVVSSPAIGSDGTVYFGSWDGKIYAIGSSTDAQGIEGSNLCEYGGINTTYNLPYQSYYLDEEFIGINSASLGANNEGKIDDLEQLKGLTCLQYFEVGHEEISGDLSNLKELVDLEVLNMHTNPEVYGDICSFSEATNLRVLVLAFNPEIDGDISCLENLNLETFAMTYTGISGDLSSLSHMTNLKALYLAGTGVSGDISALSGLINLEELVLSDAGTEGSLIYGDLSSLDNLQKLKKVALYNMEVTNCEHFTDTHPTIVEGGCSPESAHTMNSSSPESEEIIGLNSSQPQNETIEQENEQEIQKPEKNFLEQIIDAIISFFSSLF